MQMYLLSTQILSTFQISLRIVFFFSLTEKQNLKLCDSALSRDLFPSDYHCLGDNNNRPIKWMPLESINQNRYSRASDVVSIVFLYLAIFTIITFIVSLKREESSYNKLL